MVHVSCFLVAMGAAGVKSRSRLKVDEESGFLILHLHNEMLTPTEGHKVWGKCASVILL